VVKELPQYVFVSRKSSYKVNVYTMFIFIKVPTTRNFTPNVYGCIVKIT
jgi:hypothetical protein